ncbi:MAG TPA: hypothetical protein PKI11_20085 [Candidatus Hydrogenedentes bacterium]|nr:hypothetical protein [Candidatus Hydrogenedentota bacterium]HNT88808.1 hypothetical protein [Candidatus Hydrogenedentota bacterium]
MFIIRFFMIGVGVLLIALAVAAVAFSTQLARFGRTWMEDRLSTLFNTRVEIEALELAPLQRGVVLRRVTVYNPEGFDPEPAAEIERVLLQFDLRTVFADKVTIDRLLLDQIALHEKGMGKNLRTLAGAAATPTRVDAGEPRLKVRRLACTGGELRGKMVPVKLRPFEIERSGDDQLIAKPDVARILLENLSLDLITLKGLLPALF